jgi:hypothetical protein
MLKWSFRGARLCPWAQARILWLWSKWHVTMNPKVSPPPFPVLLVWYSSHRLLCGGKSPHRLGRLWGGSDCSKFTSPPHLQPEKPQRNTIVAKLLVGKGVANETEFLLAFGSEQRLAACKVSSSSVATKFKPASASQAIETESAQLAPSLHQDNQMQRGQTKETSEQNSRRC